MAGRRVYIKMSTFVCPECGFEMQLPRKHSKLREKGHIKDIYCPGCKAVRKFKEYTYKQCYKTLDGEVISA